MTTIIKIDGRRVTATRGTRSYFRDRVDMTPAELMGVIQWLLGKLGDEA